MGGFSDALAAAGTAGGNPHLANVRRDSGPSSVSELAWTRSLTRDAGLFGRYSW